ncbi:MAG: hypothetical protein CMB22_01605 [Euryarchaeota archaeon]|nr:hypothetical protein [Euryarchaeota archaeon]|tara:strand:- start:7740 stop:8333 length:594 start_codon:yes stop_codon:yes gene_type:complete
MPKLQSKSNTKINTGLRPEHDLYPTPKSCTEELLKREKFVGRIWECACGLGDISEVFLDQGHTVLSTDIIDHGYENISVVADFLKCRYSDSIPRNIVTNPPFKYANQFIKHGIELTKPHNGKLALFLRLNMLEGQKRYYEIFKPNPPARVWIFSARQTLWREKQKAPKGRSGTTAYAWFIWEGGTAEGDTRMKFIEP